MSLLSICGGGLLRAPRDSLSSPILLRAEWGGVSGEQGPGHRQEGILCWFPRSKQIQVGDHEKLPQREKVMSVSAEDVLAWETITCLINVPVGRILP